MRRIEPDSLALAVLTAALLLHGFAGERLAAEPRGADGVARLHAQLQGVLPEGWLREFDLKRERTIERLNGRMDELRRKLERRERSARFRLAAHS
ncbi:MAG: hypothetical protein IH602_12980 [Bryobacteraceae bacterium]|nr:hypothetical protein [Bryobacteraceae bacterium]